ncbi:MAG: hypothetical protein J1F71_01660 [Clostridiales bacterium]|nr:hypothetical protein [Clostridiales bacterium]
MAKHSVHIALDLGSDTIKIAYAYNDGEEHTGKIVGDPLTMTAIPSVAYYDVDDKKWLFGDEVSSVGDKPFITVVKICDLLRLLQPAASVATQKSNRNYYYKRNEFPKFYFPVRNVLTDDIDAAKRMDRTFSADRTPSEVCEMFFAYVYGIVRSRLELLFKDSDVPQIVPSLVYPPFSDSEYVEELKRLVKHAFGVMPQTVMSMAKALCAYAKFSGRMAKNDKSIIFNIGEERISLVKVTFSGSGISVDGVDGHSEPAPIGGKDIDDAVARYIEGQMSGRETMGRPPSGEEGHLAESALNTKQYLFVKDIKSAKMVLGMPIYESRAFRYGVPISASRDLLIQRYITREEFEHCIGIEDGNGIAHKIVQYIQGELSREINNDVKKIFITGGPVETYGLIKYIKRFIEPLGVKVLTFEKPDEDYIGVENDGFNIMSHEDALYAPVLGCAVASMNDITIDMVLALTYGVRLFRVSGNNVIPFFRVLVDKGTHIPQSGAEYYTPKDSEQHGITTGDNSSESAALQIMSTFYSAQDIEHSRGAPAVTYVKSGNENLLVVDTDNKNMLKKLQKSVGLRILNDSEDGTGGNSCATYFYNGRPVRIIKEVYLKLGVEIDGEGYARAYAKNDLRRNGTGTTQIEYLDGRGPSKPQYSDPFAKFPAGSYETVPKKDIDFKFKIETQLT